MLLDHTLAGRYQLGRLLGSGGMGAVYLAEDVRLRREVAIKICSTRNLPDDEAQAAAELFQAEALTLARLHHPGLTEVWDYFAHAEDWHLVMEYVPGITLREALAQAGGRLPQAQVLNFAGQLCDVLSYLHAQNPSVIFRDLKPGNIMVTPDGTLKLIDFGIARLFSPGKHADTAQFGTPGYAPPEQYGGQTEPRSDVYSLGVVVHQLLTGHNPLGSAFAIPPARAVDLSTPAAVEDVLLKATAYDPDQRFPTAADFCAALRRAAQMPQPPTRVTIPVPQPQPAADPASRSLWMPAHALPARPEAGGIGRSVVVVLLLFMLLGSLIGGGYVLRDHAAAWGTLLWGKTVGVVQPERVNVPGTLVYAAPGKNGGDDIWLREGRNAPRVLVAAEVGTSAALPTLSPDKKQLAYTLTISGTQQEQVWLRDFTAKVPQPILTKYPIVRAPAWSPDGTKLALEVANQATFDEKNADRDIVTLDIQTNKETVIVDTPSWEGGPAWSPDGTQIAFHAAYSPCWLLYVAPATGLAHTQQGQQLTSPPSNEQCNGKKGDYWPQWSSDGTRIAFERSFGGHKRVAVYHFDTHLIEGWETDKDHPSNPRPAGRPRWSPDNTTLLYEEGGLLQASDAPGPITLSQFNLQTGAITTLSGSEGARQADWR